jgi:glycerophosphoryl diester phosphodiesterase
MPARPLQLPPVIGHRGAAQYAPENTLSGFREAKRRGAAWVEFDVRLSSDGVAFVMHDDSLLRTTGFDRLSATLPWREIRVLNAGGWFDKKYANERAPSFEATIDLLAELGLGANVEIKPSPGAEVETARAVVSTIEKFWPASLPTPLLSSFKDSALAEAQRCNPDLPRASLIDRIAGNWLERARAVEAVAINTNGKKLQREQAVAVKQAGFALGVYTIDEPGLARQLVAWGADTVITDAPDTIIAALRQ